MHTSHAHHVTSQPEADQLPLRRRSTALIGRAVLAGALVFGLAACNDDDGGDPEVDVDPDVETETEIDVPEIETETEIPGVDAPEVEVD